MLAKKAVLVAVGATLFSLTLSALAQNADALAERYTVLAGSENNAKVLVSKLRDGSFNPRFEKMGYGNVDHALALAEASLQKQGVTKPTPEQLKTSLTGVLQQRADGKGWGEIAHSMGLKLGDVKRAEPRPEKVERVSHARPEKPERPERHGR